MKKYFLRRLVVPLEENAPPLHILWKEAMKMQEEVENRTLTLVVMEQSSPAGCSKPPS